MRIYRLTRTIIVAVLVVWAAAGFFANQSATATSSQTHAHFSYVTVMPGQTLWAIAEKYAPNQDPTDYIQQILQLNNLQSSNVSIGEKLALPNSN
jgi:LysM repeat protein